MFQSVRGTHDILPVEARYLSEVERHAYKLARRWGFKEIRTPMFERADLFVRGLGVMAGLVERELWTFHDKHGQKLALRADMTACVVRAYQQHDLAKQFADVTKLFYVAPVFLLGKEGEQPSRQVQQFGMEVIGSDSPAVDVELLCVALEFCRGLDLEAVKIELNSLGCDKCRAAYYDALREFFSNRQNELCNNCKRKFRPHPTWTLSCPEEGCTTLAQLSPTILGYLCGDCKTHFNHVKHLIKALDLEVNFNPRVVRDIEYYNRTCFRIVAGDRVLGYGGRFDGLVARFGGSDTPAAGFSISLDETVELFAQQATYEIDELDAVFIPEGAESTRVLLPIVQRLRQSGARVEILYRESGDKPDSRFIVRLSENDALRGLLEVTSSSGRTEQVTQERLQAHLQRALGLDEAGPQEEQGGHSQASNNGGGRQRRKLQRSTRRDGREWSRREAGAEESSVELGPEEVREADAQGEAEDVASRRRRRRRRQRHGGEAGEVSAERPAYNENAARNGEDEPEESMEAEAEVEEAGAPRRGRQERGGRDRANPRAGRPERNERNEGQRRPRPEGEEVRRPAADSVEVQPARNPQEPRRRREPHEKTLVAAEVRPDRKERFAPPAPDRKPEDQGKTFIPAFTLGLAPGKAPVFQAAPSARPAGPGGLSAIPGAEPAGPPRWSIVPRGGGLGISSSEGEDSEPQPTQNEVMAGHRSSGAREGNRGSRRRR